MKYCVYILRCPITKDVKYVGMTTNMVDRFRRHLSNKENIQKYNWIKFLGENNLLPIAEVMYSDLTKEQAEQKEINTIKLFSGLFNIEKGGLTPPSRKGMKDTQKTKRLKFENSPLKKVVIQKTIKGVFVNEFSGVREASRITGIYHDTISQVASKKEIIKRGKPMIRKSAGGYKWEYKEG